MKANLYGIVRALDILMTALRRNYFEFTPSEREQLIEDLRPLHAKYAEAFRARRAVIKNRISSHIVDRDLD